MKRSGENSTCMESDPDGGWTPTSGPGVGRTGEAVLTQFAASKRAPSKRRFKPF